MIVHKCDRCGDEGKDGIWEMSFPIKSGRQFQLIRKEFCRKCISKLYDWFNDKSQ